MKRKGPSPTQRSLAYLRERSYVAEITEHWNAHAGIRQDLFGVIDIVAYSRVEPYHGLYVQTTTAENISGRLQKMTAAWIKPNPPKALKPGQKPRKPREPAPSALPYIMLAGTAITIHGWYDYESLRVVSLKLRPCPDLRICRGSPACPTCAGARVVIFGEEQRVTDDERKAALEELF